MTFDERAFLARIAGYKRIIDLWVREAKVRALRDEDIEKLEEASGYLANILDRARERR